MRVNYALFLLVTSLKTYLHFSIVSQSLLSVALVKIGNIKHHNGKKA